MGGDPRRVETCLIRRLLLGGVEGLAAIDSLIAKCLVCVTAQLIAECVRPIWYDICAAFSSDVATIGP